MENSTVYDWIASDCGVQSHVWPHPHHKPSHRSHDSACSWVPAVSPAACFLMLTTRKHLQVQFIQQLPPRLGGKTDPNSSDGAVSVVGS